MQRERSERLVVADWNSRPGDVEASGWIEAVKGGLVLPSGGVPTMARDGVASLLDYGVAIRGLGNLVHRCHTAAGAPWAPHVPVEVSLILKLGSRKYLVLGRAPALGRLLEAGRTQARGPRVRGG